MTVWVEQPGDEGSAVWGCDACDRGAWCWDHTTARLEARAHATSHGPAKSNPVLTKGRARGPHRDDTRDTRIRELRDAGHTIRHIATLVGISPAGVLKTLQRERT